MQLTLDKADSQFTVQSYERGQIMVADAVIDYPVIIDAQGYRRWPLDDIGANGAAALTWRDFAEPLSGRPEILLFGTGAAHAMPDARVLVGMHREKIGFEVMHTPAACRTYNVLLSEGRKVAAAVLMI